MVERLRLSAGSNRTVGAWVLAQRGGDVAVESLALYFAAVHQSVEDQSVDAGQQSVGAVLDVRDAVRGEEQPDGLAAGVLAGHEDLPQFWVAHALDGAGMAGERAAATLAGESLSGEQHHAVHSRVARVRK